jgi:general secretion pathway protein D
MKSRLLKWASLCIVFGVLRFGIQRTRAQTTPDPPQTSQTEESESGEPPEPAPPPIPVPIPPPAEEPTPSPSPAQPTQPPAASQPVIEPPVKLPTPAVTNRPTVSPAVNVPSPKPTVGIIDFQGTPLSAVLEYYAHLTRRSIISAPGVQAVVYFRSQTDLNTDEAIQALDTVLAINGIGIVPMGEKFLKVVQIATAKQEGLPFGGALPPADTLMTHILPLRFAEAAEVIAALQPYMHPYGQLIPLTKSNAILITETGANLNQMLEIIKYIDQPSPLRMQTKIYILMHAKASDVAQRLTALIQETLQLGARPSAPTTPGQPALPGRPPVVRPGQPATAAGAAPAGEEAVVEGKAIITSDERTNKLFIFTRPANFAFFDKIIAELDAKVEPDVIMKVIELNYANAEDIAGLLNSLISGGAAPTVRRTTTPTTPRAGGAPAPPPPVPIGGITGAGAENAGFLQFAQGVRILPDQRTNSLIVMATKEDMLRLEELVKDIDTPVAQVLIEVVIAEVTLKNDLEVGINLFKRLFDSRSVSSTGGTGVGKGTPVELPRASDAASALFSNLPTAAALASSGGLTYFASFRNLKLDAVVNLLASNSRFKVLSTPTIQTLHNQEADILVGESRPVPVSTVTSIVGTTGTLSTGALNSNIEFKDIAIELKVTPRINPNGYVTMDIQQKVNDLGGTVNLGGTDVPIITKREAKSSVSVKDQSTIVLGGLIREDRTVTENKVPLLGDIPFFGLLFKGKTQNKNRNELIVFIRPTVMRTDAEAVAEAHRRVTMLTAGKELELEKRFESPEPGAPSSALTNLPPPKAVTPSEEQTPPLSEGPESTPAVSDRETAKLKALMNAESTR